MSRAIEARAQTDNKVRELREWVQPFVARLGAFPEVEGVVILAGVAQRPYRSFADNYSDVDLSVFINTPVVPPGSDLKTFTLANQERLPAWLPDYEFAVPLPSGGEREVNLHQLLYSYEERDDVEWPEAKKEAYAYTGDVVYDRAGLVSALIEKKASYDHEAASRRLARLAVQVPWNGWLNPARQLKRGFVEAAHDLLNEAADLIVEGLYLINARFRPHRKWRLMIAEDLPWRPEGYRPLMRELLLVSGFTEADVERRAGAARTLWTRMLRRALEQRLIPEDYEHYLATHVSLNRQLRVSTLADRVVAAARELSLPVGAERLRAFVNLSVPESVEHFLQIVADPSQECPAFFRQELATLRICHDSISRALTSRA